MPNLPAPAPSRASGKFSISFGLLNIGVDLFTSTEEVRVKRSQYTRSGEKVGNETRIKNEDGTYGAAVERSEIVKKYDSEKGLVDLSDDEIDALSTVVPGVADLLGVLRFDYLANGSYVPNGQVWQVRASKLGSGRTAKPNPGGEKAFTLLLTALKQEASFALLRFAKAGVVYHAALLPTGRLIGLYTDEEVRQDRVLPQPEVSEAELTFARELLRFGAQAERVELTNDLAAKVAVYAAEKAVLPSFQPAAVVEPKGGGQVIDLIAQLQASINAAKVSVSA